MGWKEAGEALREGAVTHVQARRAALASVLIVAGAEASPGDQVPHRGEAGHLGDDHLRDDVADARDGGQVHDGDAKGREHGAHICVDRVDGRFSRLDLIEVRLQQEPMVLGSVCLFSWKVIANWLNRRTNLTAAARYWRRGMGWSPTPQHGAVGRPTVRQELQQEERR